MPPIKHTKIIKKGGHVVVGGTPGAGATPSDEQISFTRTTPIRASSNPFKLGITFTHDTFPSGSQGTAVANAKALMVACNWDYINMHSHGFGENGPWTNEDKRDGKTYADRGTWAGWTAWDTRMQHMRDCGGAATKYIITLLPPGWCKMDGGAYNDSTADPLNSVPAYSPDPNRTWENLDSDVTIRHTDAHMVDMVSIGKAIALRHTDVDYFSIINEQKGNFPGAGYVEEISNDGLLGANINNYYAQERYQEALATAMASLVGAGRSNLVEVIGPYLALDGNGADVLAAAYAGIGFPQPAAAADVATNKYKTYWATQAPFMTRTKTYLEWFLANVASSARSNWLGIEWKTLASDNDIGNWAVFDPFKWYFFEQVQAGMQKIKTYTGVSVPTTKIIAMESYVRKVTDDIHVPSGAEQGAMLAEMLRLQLIEGMHADLRWAPEQGAGKANRNNLFTSTTATLAAGGGVALPGYTAHKAFCDHFRGVNIYDTTSTDAHKVTAVASPTKTLLINHTPNPLTVQINGGPVQGLTGFEVRVVTA